MPTQLSKRTLLLGAAALAISAGGWLSLNGQTGLYTTLTPERLANQIPADEAHALAESGDLILIDIRRPDEWAATGSPEGAVQLDMRREDFDTALLALRAVMPDVPVAVICMRGVRSARLSNRLIEAGFTDILDVAEGMLGSAAGPGWIARGLPTYGRG